MMTIVKQGSYHLLMTTTALVGVISAAAIFFFGVGYINLALLFLAMFASYLLVILTLAYALVRFFRPANRQLIVGNIVLILSSLVLGVGIGRLLIG